MDENEKLQFLRWWTETSDDDAAKALAKAAEHGSLDLDIIGAAMHADGEAGIAFYVLGKAARAVSNVLEGRPVSEDTWLDICTYGMMARRVRETGRWP